MPTGQSQPSDPVVAWLLGGDVAVRYQTCRDLLSEDRPDVQRRIASQGDARLILAAHSDPGWGDGFYEPRWTCPHYSLLELRDLAVAPDHPSCVTEVSLAFERHTGSDGGFNPPDSTMRSDVCMNGMFLAYACCRSTSGTVQPSFRRGSGRRAQRGRITAGAQPLPARGQRGSDSTRVHPGAPSGAMAFRRAARPRRAAQCRGSLRSAARRRRRRGPPRQAPRWSLVRGGGIPGPGPPGLPAGEPNRWVTLIALRVLAWAAGSPGELRAF